MPSEFLYGVRTRRAARAGLDGLTPLLLVGFVLALVGGGIYMHIDLKDLIEQKRVDPSFSPSVLWTMVIAFIVLLFAIIGPMVLLGVFVASKILKFPLGGAAYLKACGVATVPALLIALGKLLPPNFVLILIIMVAIVPVAYFVLKIVFELSFPEGALSFVLAGVTGLIGFFISAFIIGALAVGGVAANLVANRDAQLGTGSIGSLPGMTPPMSTTPRTPNGGTAAPTKSPVESLRDTLTARVAQTPDTSREQQERELKSLKVHAEQIGGTNSAEVLNLLQQLEARAAAAPSEKPEATLFQDLVATTVWRPTDAQLAQLAGDEVSFKNLNLRLPKGFRADLDSSESDGKGLSFSAGRGDSGKLIIRTAPAGNVKQRRPWVTTQTVQTAAAVRDQLFTVDGTGATVDVGTINGMVFTRVVHDPGKRFGVQGKSAQYVTRTSDGWLVLEAIGPSGSAAGTDAIEGSIRTLRQRPQGDPMNDPFSPDALAARLAEDPDRVAKLLREKGKPAESAVIPQLKHADARAARAAATVLAEIGTEKSLPALQEAAKSHDSFLAGAAREAIKKLQPDTMDAVAEALLDLEGGDVFRKREALDRLAKTPPDEARREKVATILETLCLGREAFHLGDSLPGAMSTWAGKYTVPRLLPLLDKNAGMHERRLAMDVFAKLKDERTVLPILRWIIYDTENVTKTLVEMGPVAEPEIVKTLKDPNATARTAAARIAQEIGTIRSVAALKRASLDQRDPGAAAAARVALDIVNERVRTAKATATTAPVR
jgi:hypothetical protein